MLLPSPPASTSGSSRRSCRRHAASSPRARCTRPKRSRPTASAVFGWRSKESESATPSTLVDTIRFRRPPTQTAPIDHSVSVTTRRPRSLTAATRPRPTSPPRASSRRSRRPRPLRACGAPAGCVRARGRRLPPVSRPHPPPTRPRKATSGRARRDFPRGRSGKWHSRLIVGRRRCWRHFAWRGQPGPPYLRLLVAPATRASATAPRRPGLPGGG